MSDPNYILSQEEFHKTMAEHLGRDIAADRSLRHAFERQIEGLRTTGGWLFVSIGLWALLIGIIILTGREKGRPF